jgi:Uncharacterized conserved protein
MTGFARFFLAMLIIAPLSIIGASYYNGQDGIQTIKELVGLGGSSTQTEQTKEAQPVDTKPSKEYVNSQIKKLQDDLTEKEERVANLYLENETLKKQLEEKDKEVNEVKKELNSLKDKIKEFKQLDFDN